jgi:hypothetical protein
MDDHLREILSQVRAGQVTPQEAARLLDRPSTATGEDPGGEEEPARNVRVVAADSAPPAPDSDRVAGAETSKVVVRSAARPVRVVADPLVATASVDGPHVLRRHGDVLIIDCDPTDAHASGAYQQTPSGTPWWRQLTSGSWGVRVTVRVNPQLALDVEVSAAPVEVIGMRAPLSLAVNAGSARIVDHRAPLNGVVRAGSLRAEAMIDSGDSTVRVETGSADITLLPHCEVRVRAEVEMGSVKFYEASGATRKLESGSTELVVGSGAGHLDIKVLMGSLKVRIA